MGEIRVGDIVHFEDAPQKTVTKVERKGKMVTIAARDLHLDLPVVPNYTAAEYRALTAAEKAQWVADREALAAAAQASYFESTHRAASPIAKALWANVTVAYKKPE